MLRQKPEPTTGLRRALTLRREVVEAISDTRELRITKEARDDNYFGSGAWTLVENN
jgi:hypothetical protein